VGALAAQPLALLVLIAVFVVPWWLALLGGVVLIVGGTALLDAVFPLVAAEPFGSAADTRRAAFHFWLAAPLCVALLILAVISMVNR
jgi:hypothetical protein